jgi:hypothetical protein
MFVKALFVMMMALSLMSVAGDPGRNDPIPHCWPCPYSN